MPTMRSGLRHRVLAAGAVVLAVAAGCASQDTPVPESREATPAEAPAASGAQDADSGSAAGEPRGESPEESPTDKPTAPEPAAPEPAAPEDEAPELAAREDEACPAGEHSHDGEGCHGHSDTTDGANGSGGDSGAVCEDGLTRFEDLVTEEDNGCRPQVCDNGRGDDGHCLFAEEELTEEEAAALADADPLPWEEYGLEGCTEVALGMCDLDGVLHCHNTITGWAECPGGGTAAEGSCPAVEPDDPFAFTGPLLANEAVPLVLMEEGTWRIDACVRGMTTGEPSRFTVSLFTPPNEEGRGKGGVLFDEEAVVNGEWTTEIYLVWGEYEPLPFELWVTPVGGGTWTVHIIAVSE